MNPFESPLLLLATAAASILSATTTAGLDPRATRHREVGAMVGWLDCRLDAEPGHGTRLLLTNTGALPLAQGTRFAWVTLGTPAAQGEVGKLPSLLGRGESVALLSSRSAHGSGCTAVMLHG